MRLRTKAAAAIVALLLTTAADCKNQGGADPGTGGHEYRDPGQATTQKASPGAECAEMKDPAVPPNLGQKRYITVWTCLETEYGPYTVTYHASDLAGNTLASTEEHVVGSEPFNRIIGYDTGQKMTLSVQIRPSRPGSKLGYIIAKDGPGNVKKGRIDGGYQIRVEINAAR